MHLPPAFTSAATAQRAVIGTADLRALHSRGRPYIHPLRAATPRNTPYLKKTLVSGEAPCLPPAITSAASTARQRAVIGTADLRPLYSRGRPYIHPLRAATPRNTPYLRKTLVSGEAPCLPPAITSAASTARQRAVIGIRSDKLRVIDENSSLKQTSESQPQKKTGKKNVILYNHRDLVIERGDRWIGMIFG